MKKQYIYSALILTAVLTAGCAKEFENTPDDRNGAAIELSSVSTDPMTKAVITGTSFTTDEAAAGIGLFLLDGSGNAYGSNSGNVRYGYSDGKWTAASPLRVGGTAGTLYGYYPYSSTVTDITAIPVASSVNGTDYLYGSIAEITSAKAKTESLSLSHALARVSLLFRLDGSYEGSGALSAISLSGDCVAASGTLNAKTGSINATKGAFSADGLDRTVTKSASTTVECLVVPVAIESGTPELKIACTIDGKAYATTFTGNLAALAQGKQTTIELTVKNTSITVDGSSIGAWGDGGTQTVTVGGDYKVTVKLAEGVTPHDILLETYVEGDVVKILAFPQSKRMLGCALSAGADLSKEQKTDGITAFTLSNIGSDVTATIGYVFTVNVVSNITELGTVSGGGTYFQGTTITITATANDGFLFQEWRDAKGKRLDWTNPQVITVTSDINVIAIFGISLSDNVINGIFTVNKSNKKVLFSKGNLYCSGVEFNSDGTVKSMDNAYWGVENCQYGFAPSESKVSRDKNHISHFLWCEVAQNALASKYNVEWNNQTSFFANTVLTIFGINIWSVLTKDEWVYLLNTEGKTDGSARNQTNRFAKAKVHGVNGLLIFPDGYFLPDGYTSDGGVGISKINDIRATYPSGSISNEVWLGMEHTGVVFLPAAGERYGYHGNEFANLIQDVDSNVYLWSSSPCSDGKNAYCMFFGTTFANPMMDKNREYALAVRLVTECQ